MKKVFLLTALFFGGMTLMSAQTQFQKASDSKAETVKKETSVKKAAEQQELKKAEVKAQKKSEVKKADAIRKNEVINDEEKGKADALRQEIKE